MLSNTLKDFRIILASRSPRRQQLLSELGLDFDVLLIDFTETYPEHLKGKEIASYVAHSKAISLKDRLSDKDILITADTIVWCEGMLLGKPVDADDAFRILNLLSGNTHEVITGVCILSGTKERLFTVSTQVTFDSLSEDEINFYINNFKPYDKAGAYGIQEWIGLVACSDIEGSYFNVVGLPVQQLYKELREFIEY